MSFNFIYPKHFLANEYRPHTAKKLAYRQVRLQIKVLDKPYINVLLYFFRTLMIMIWDISAGIVSIHLIKMCYRSIFEKYNKCYLFIDVEGGGGDGGECIQLTYNVAFEIFHYSSQDIIEFHQEHVHDLLCFIHIYTNDLQNKICSYYLKKKTGIIGKAYTRASLHNVCTMMFNL